VDSFWKGFSCDTKLSLAHRCRTALQEESISSLGGQEAEVSLVTFPGDDREAPFISLDLRTFLYLRVVTWLRAYRSAGPVV
jgi:hypothetical protein